MFAFQLKLKDIGLSCQPGLNQSYTPFTAPATNQLHAVNSEETQHLSQKIAKSRWDVVSETETNDTRVASMVSLKKIYVIQSVFLNPHMMSLAQDDFFKKCIETA